MTNEISQMPVTNSAVQATLAEAGEGGSDSAQTGATNAVVQIPPMHPPAPESPRHPVNWTWPAVAIVAIAALAWAGKKLKAGTAAFEKSVEDELVDSVLDAVAKEAPDRTALRAELADAVNDGSALRSGPLADILRIEESYEKQASGRYLRHISVLRRKEGPHASLTKIESELGWEYIPEAVREQFIVTRENKVVRLVYDAKKGLGE